MFGLWAVARHSFRQCIRTKVAGLFIILLAVALAVLPFIMKGDGTLAGQIRTFLSYSLAITGILLSLVTVFLAVGVVTGDVQHKQIISLATKPLARWQYILGRWLGVVVLDVLLLAVAGGVIYGLAQYLRRGEALNPTDRRAVETEIFTARARVRPLPLDLDARIEARIRELRENGEYDAVIAAYIAYSPGDETLALDRLRGDLERQFSEEMQSIAPGKSTAWQFEGIDVAGEAQRGPAQILQVDRQAGVVVVRADPALLSRLIYSGPVRLNNADGQVAQVGDDVIAVRFHQQQLAAGGEASRFEAGREVELTAEPTVQITFKATATRVPSDRGLDSSWEVSNPSTGYVHMERLEHPHMLPATLVVSARVVDELGRTNVRYYNLNLAEGEQTSVTILHDDMGVLYRVGTFEGNFIRSLVLILVQLTFLAGLGVLAASFLSFPVACVFTLFLLIVQRAMGFLMEATNPNPSPSAQPGLFDYFSHYIVLGLKWLLPGEGVVPGDALVDGMRIPVLVMADAVGKTVLVVTALLLVLACAIFRKRELARVQV